MMVFRLFPSESQINLMIPLVRHETCLRRPLNQFPVVGLIGARQVGKTTPARRLAEGMREQVTFFDVEDPTDVAHLADFPRGGLIAGRN